MVGSYSCGKQEGVGTGTLPGSPGPLLPAWQELPEASTDQRSQRHFQGEIFRGGGGGGVALGGRGHPRYSRTPAGAARTPAPLLRSALGRTRPAPSSASGGERAEETPGTAKAKARGSERLPSLAGKLRPGVEGGMGLGPKARGQDRGEGCSGGGTGPLGASGSLLETRGPRLRLSQA